MHKPILIAAVALLLAACSTTKIFYSFADDFIEGRAASHLDLDEEGEAVLQRQVGAFMLWHRTNMLPRYADYLRRQAALVDGGQITRAAIRDSFAEVRALWEGTVKGIAPYAAAVLVGHTGEPKREHLRKQLAERLDEQLEDMKDARAERLERRSERIIENFERFTGDLDAKQRKNIGDYTAARLDDRAVWLEHRRRRNQAFIAFLAKRPGEKEIAGLMEKIVLRSYEVVQPEYKAVSEARAAGFEKLLFDIVASLSPEQRNELAGNLRRFADDFSELSAALQ